MTNKLLTVVIAVAFATVSAASWAQTGTSKTVTNQGVGGNASPTYPKVEASKNKKVTNHGAGGNATPSYPKTGTH